MTHIMEMGDHRKLARRPDQVEHIASVIRVFTPEDYVAIDTETTGLHFYKGDYLTGMSIAYRSLGQNNLCSWYVPVNHPNSNNLDPSPIIEALNQTAATQVFHNATFDWTFLAPYGYHLPQALWDTKVVAWLMNENARNLGLKNIGAELFGFDVQEEQKALKKIMAGRPVAEVYKELRQQDPWSGRGMAKAAMDRARELSAASKKDWKDLTANDIWEYGAKDAELTLLIYEWQYLTVYETGGSSEIDVRPAIEREMHVQQVLWRMHTRGIQVDLGAAFKLRARYDEELDEIASSFPVNLDSPTQVASYLYDRLKLPCWQHTSAGGRSVDKTSLQELEGMHPAVERILRYRKVKKMQTAYVGALVNHVGFDGRVHTSLSSTSTVTGRLSSKDPNLQTIPREEMSHEVRALFIPGEGNELWEYDLSQAELRVMAGYAGEEAMIRALDEGRDLHGETAASIFGPDYTPEQRRLAKNLNFGFAYGIGPSKFAATMMAGTGRPVTGTEIREAERILNGYRATYPNLVALMEYLESKARENGWIPLHVPGRYRRFRSPGVQVPYYTALNFIVQGGIAEFMKDMMLAVEDGDWNVPARLLLQVHDSLVFEVAPGKGEAVRDALQETANAINPFAMPMIWEAKQWVSD